MGPPLLSVERKSVWSFMLQAPTSGKYVGRWQFLIDLVSKINVHARLAVQRGGHIYLFSKFQTQPACTLGNDKR